MREVDLARLDLSLLVVLRALLDTSSVTRTAARLEMSQPAVSRALARLRAILGDRLLVKGGAGMLPTARAEALAGPLASVLAGIEAIVDAPPAFDPATATRVFRVATTDYGATAILPGLAAAFFAQAPHAALEIEPFSSDVFRRLAEGALDLALYSDDPAPGSLRARELFVDDYACLVRGGHPMLAEFAASGAMPMPQFLRWPHVLVSVFGGRAGVVDEALARRGLHRRIGLWLPYFATAAMVAASSDLILTLPSRIAARFAPLTGARLLRPPVELESFGYRVIWHERAHGDPATAWLRRLIASGVAQSGLV